MTVLFVGLIQSYTMIQDGSRWSVGSWVLNQPFRIQEVAKKVQMNHVKIFLTVDSMWYVRKVIPSWDWGENDDPLSKKNWRKINTCQLLRINFYTQKNVKCINNSTTAHTTCRAYKDKPYFFLLSCHVWLSCKYILEAPTLGQCHSKQDIGFPLFRYWNSM